VTAQERAPGLAVADAQEQMSVGPVRVDHLDLDLALAVDAEVEVLTAAIRTDVDLRDAERRAPPSIPSAGDRRSCDSSGASLARAA
jgi:fumarylacetoacetate (FAA) hydrolase family protein